MPDPGQADAGGQSGEALAALPAGIAAVLLMLGLLVITVGGAAASPPPGCGQAGTATSFGAVTLDAEQMGYAGTIVKTTAAYAGGALPAYAAVVALAAADTESGLRNLPGGDRDSAGLFQIRTGLHGADVATDPVKSTLWFLDALVRVPDWRTIPLTEAAADAERPALAYRGRYAGPGPGHRRRRPALAHHAQQRQSDRRRRRRGRGRDRSDQPRRAGQHRRGGPVPDRWPGPRRRPLDRRAGLHRRWGGHGPGRAGRRADPGLRRGTRRRRRRHHRRAGRRDDGRR